MKTFAFAFMLTLAGCATTPNNSTISSSIVGVWCASEDEGKTCWGYDQFYVNGKIDACGALPNVDTGEPEPYGARGTYDVKGDVLCQYVEAVSAGMALQPGDKLCSRIISITNREYVYKDQKDGKVDRYYRFNGSKPCQSSIDQLSP